MEVLLVVLLFLLTDFEEVKTNKDRVLKIIYHLLKLSNYQRESFKILFIGYSH